jgi:hypothetical protein
MTDRPARLAAMLVLAGTLLPAGAVAQTSAGTTAQADLRPAAERFPAAGTAMLLAQDLARGIWGGDPCGGDVEIAWGADDDPAVNARSVWTNPRAIYGFPDLNTACRITLNAGLPFSWPKLCTVVVHEYGHLAGWQHGADGPDIMSPVYRGPVAPCTTVADPTAPAQAPIQGVSVTLTDAASSGLSVQRATIRRKGHAHHCPPSQGREPGRRSAAHADPPLQRRSRRVCPARRRQSLRPRAAPASARAHPARDDVAAGPTTG